MPPIVPTSVETCWQALGSINRHSRRLQVVGASQKTRTVAGHEHFSTIREALPFRTKSGTPARKSPTASPALRRTARGCVARRPSHGSSGTWWPLMKGHFAALIGSDTRQVCNELKTRNHGFTARMWTGDELTEPNAFRSLARECKNGRLRAAFMAPHVSEESMV